MCFEVPLDSSAPPEPLQCHCRACRRFHASAFAALLPLSSMPEGLSAALAASQLAVFESECGGLSTRLSRYFCKSCKSVIGATPSSGPGSGSAAAYLAIGCITDESIASSLALAWQVGVSTASRQLAVANGARWWTATATGRPPSAPPRVLRGRCACGACAFSAQSGAEFQTQHCYCNLCRRMSGSVAQTWVPCRPNGFVWEAPLQMPSPEDTTAAAADDDDAAAAAAPLQLVRTTGHGQRHMCGRCGTTLTIVYDAQPDCIWPVAGVLDDESLPVDLEDALCRSIHICVGMMQPWYELPDDGIPRLKFAG